MRILVLLLCLLISTTVFADSFCGQHGVRPKRLAFLDPSPRADAVTIDYAVFYTPAARDAKGGEAGFLQTLTTAFESVNTLFAQSGSTIIHRVVHTEELPINVSSTDMTEAGTELAQAFDFQAAMEAAEADTMIRVVLKQTSPAGAYAGIPTTYGQALSGSAISMGVGNLKENGITLSHEIGHTLGGYHDYVESNDRSLFFIPPSYGTGNHFVGANTGICYYTLMSALRTCRVVGFEDQQAQASNYFSNPNVLYEGTATGQADIADSVRAFDFWAPYVGSARGVSQVPPSGGEEGGGDNGGSQEGDPVLTMAVKQAKSGKQRAKGACEIGNEIRLVKRTKKQGDKLLQTKTCVEKKQSGEGKFVFPIKRKGRYCVQDQSNNLEECKKIKG